LSRAPKIALVRARIRATFGRNDGDLVIESIGNTPLVNLSALAGTTRVTVAGKCEWFNPGGSVKDRAALGMIRDGERRGALRPGMTILDSTSGNTGIGYAWIGAALGYSVELCVPANLGAGRRRALAAYGAALVETDALEGSDGAMFVARRRAKAHPNRYFYPDQYSNPANLRAHYETTGPEIVRQSEGRVTHFVAGLGTTGTMMGVGMHLKERDASAVLVAVQPDVPMHGLEGVKHMPTAMVPALYDPSILDDTRIVTTEEALATCARASRECGVWVGPSAGAALHAAIAVARELDSAGRGGFVVALLPDSGERYDDATTGDTGG
jgi:cysteine synthase B